MQNSIKPQVPGQRENLTGVAICIICQGRNKRDLPLF